jgi:hypothetical protein
MNNPENDATILGKLLTHPEFLSLLITYDWRTTSLIPKVALFKLTAVLTAVQFVHCRLIHL